MDEETERVKYIMHYWSKIQLARDFEELEKENKKLRETNEEHRKINGDLRKENQKLVKVIDEAIEYLENNNNYLEGQKRLIANILTPQNGYLKADIDYEISKNQKILDILNKLTELKGGNND